MEFRMRFLLSTPLWIFIGQSAAESDTTDVTQNLNDQIAASGNCGTYRGYSGGCGGGRGVLIRNPFDAYEGGGPNNWLVVPSTFWHNDIAVGNTVFPSTLGSQQGGFDWGVTSYNVDCPHSGTNGYWDISGSYCEVDPGSGDNSPWRYASTGYIIGDAMANLMSDWDNIQDDDWGWGVFYPTDSNAVDYRCRWLGDFSIYDCPPDPSGMNWWRGSYVDLNGVATIDDTKFGAGVYPAGNPYAGGGGGGTGCHFDKRGSGKMDQTDAYGDNGINLVKNSDCQCNDEVFNDDWSHWVDWWIAFATPKADFQDEWWLHGGSGAPFRALDQVACWTNNLRDMINLQNNIWWKRWEWSNQMAPETNWQAGDPNSMWAYWGWNEIPTQLDQLTPYENHQAIFIHLPTSICGNGGGDDSIWCLGNGQQAALENDLDNWVNGPDQFGYLVPGYDNIGNRPGSYIVVVREYYDASNDRWAKYFFCENWQGPTGKYKVVSWSWSDSDSYGGCYIDYGSMYHRFYGSATNVGKLKYTMDEAV